ncbi:hypothetical protein ACGF0J_35475 [Nonomuraea sp. NPDC047897]|uniref:hypothetical protein n=1 Tax=Nonomuraea sp. NPDC047897 TaxID=3364346 RepID=UPI00371C1FC7
MGENFVLSTGAWTVFGLLAWLRHDGSMGRRAAAGLALGVLVLLDLAFLMGIVAANVDAGQWRQASAPAYGPAMAFAGGVLAVVVGAVAVSPRRRRAAEDGPELPDDCVTGLPSGKPTIWIGGARNRRYFWRTIAAVCLMLVLTVMGTTWMVLPAVLSLLTLHFWSGVTAVFDGGRLTIRGGLPFLFPRHVELARIETAEAVRIDPRQCGWGWRLRSTRRHMVVVRKGEALLVALRDGGEVIVTVDDAAAGAAEIRRALRYQAHARHPADRRDVRPAEAGEVDPARSADL